MIRLYRGERVASGPAVVTVDGCPLLRRHDLHDHAITFEWGYDGSGPAQLALALLADHLSYHSVDLAVAREIARREEQPQAGDGDQLAQRIHQAFKRHTVGHLPPVWTLTSADVSAALKEIAGW